MIFLLKNRAKLSKRHAIKHGENKTLQKKKEIRQRNRRMYSSATTILRLLYQL